MIADIQYGGRVTDDHDRHLLNTYAKVWFGDHLFRPDYAFYKGKYLIHHMLGKIWAI